MRMEQIDSRLGCASAPGDRGAALALTSWAPSSRAEREPRPGDTDLALTKSDNPDPVTVGDNLTYTIKVQNRGRARHRGDGHGRSSRWGRLRLRDRRICQRDADKVTCDLGQVDADTKATVTIVVKTKKAGTLSNTASVAAPRTSSWRTTRRRRPPP